MPTTFFNTTSLTGEQLKQAVVSATNQDNAIFLVYLNTRKKYTGWDIYAMMQRAGKRWPVTSCRRSLSNLMKKGYLVKLSCQKEGEYGKPEHFYQLNFIKYPSNTGLEQANLFQ